MSVQAPALKKKRPKKAKLPRTLEPNPCVILAVDAGREAGAAILMPDGVLAWAVKPGGEDRVVAVAVACAEKFGLPLVVVRETWTSGRFGQGDRRMNPATIAGLASAWGRWEGALLARGVSARSIVKVNSQTWKAATIGCAFGRKSAENKALAVQRARVVFGIEPPSEDAAEALCMAEWGAHAGEVAKAIPKRRAKKLGKPEMSPAQAELKEVA
jgi:hypothetical protein